LLQRSERADYYTHVVLVATQSIFIVAQFLNYIVNVFHNP